MRNRTNHHVFQILDFLLKSLIIAVKYVAELVENVSSLEEKLKVDLFLIKVYDRRVDEKSHFFIGNFFWLGLD